MKMQNPLPGLIYLGGFGALEAAEKYFRGERHFYRSSNGELIAKSPVSKSCGKQTVIHRVTEKPTDTLNIESTLDEIVPINDRKRVSQNLNPVDPGLLSITPEGRIKHDISVPYPDGATEFHIDDLYCSVMCKLDPAMNAVDAAVCAGRDDHEHDRSDGDDEFDSEL